MLPDDVLVEIFFYVNNWDIPDLRSSWHVLVHVCRRWRSVVFASPRRLNLRLEYEGHRPISEMLDLWPVLPVTLLSSLSVLPTYQRWDNLVAALESEHYNCIREIHIHDMLKPHWERLLASTRKPFPELTHLELSVALLLDSNVLLVLPDSFLGGCAPRLQTLSLDSIPFPPIPKLLLSANGLVTLSIRNIPHSGYISPDAMATALTVMTKLESLELHFFFPPPDPASRPLPPHTRFVHPALTRFTFNGVQKYLEYLLARIETPLLDYIAVTFSMDFNFDLPQLQRLIGHTEVFKTFNHAELVIGHLIRLDLYPKTRAVYHHQLLGLAISCGDLELDRKLSSLAQVYSSSFFPLISAVEELKIVDYLSPDWEDDMENTQWLELLGPFTALKNLYLSNDIASHVFSALLDFSVERVTEVLPALQSLFIYPEYLLEGPQEPIKIFVTTRRRAGRPVSVHCGSWSGRWVDITEDLTSGD